MLAFKDKVFAPGTLKSPQELLQLYSSLGDSFATNADPSDLPTAYALAKTVDTSAVKTYSIDNTPGNVGDLLNNPPMSEYGGAWVLVPNDPTYGEIHQFVHQIFSDEGLPEASASATPTDAGASTGFESP